ncbi:MAG: leucyl aminopeptidase family protein [Pseudomonadota bacterium]
MSLQLPASAPLDATHHRTAPSPEELERADYLIVALPTQAARGDGWPSFPHERLVRSLLDRLTKVGDSRVVHAVLPDESATGLSAGFVPVGEEAFATLSAARKLVAAISQQQIRRVAVIAPGFAPDEQARVLRALVSALAVAAVAMPSAKHARRSAPTAVRLEQIDSYGADIDLDFKRELAEAEGNSLARWLAALPSNELTVDGYLARVEALAGEAGWEFDVMREAELSELGANAYLAVSQGSRGHAESQPALVHLRYRPAGLTPGVRAELSLVGKGICFDTGGVNVKSAMYMQTMNEDMGGSAVALGTLLAITRLRLPIAVDAWLALAENAIGPAAYKPQDLITAANGTTIEVIHTDAEGRMVLADALHLAAREEPALLVDLATLTGACVNALTTAYSGVFVNRPELQDMMVEAGRRSGERVWPFPLSEDFDRALESDIADIKQCTIDGRGDHILAARFLGRFVPESVPWVHIDLASSRHKGGLAHVPTDITGFGVGLLMSLLVDQMLHDDGESA